MSRYLIVHDTIHLLLYYLKIMQNYKIQLKNKQYIFQIKCCSLLVFNKN